MSETHDVIFLFDVDNTLLDNDRMKSDLGKHVEATFGEGANDRLWALYEEERAKHGYADFLGTLERFRLEHLHDPRALLLANWVMDYPFIERLYPDALGVVRHVRQWGLPVILTDGDGVFQPHKLERAGLWTAFDGHVLNYIHKEEELDSVRRAYPSRHYVLIDDKLKLLNAVKSAWGNAVTTVFPRQGHYANDPDSLADQGPADIEVDRIADLMEHDFSALSPA
ncbi:haloacid dehalogenase [Methyloceanibacter superfactus]|jgi:FMN phosphatase YigB (HAD superfamily)|uniref:Haloacid dehalogenase n=1 Tax=Methyloceanibacter superfactus TaxID=1774969 RepID=A0A1E3VVR3_9HYPH|nr:HAD family hydrolase [Methyloceanibacter superfactus]ODR97605.1 haloacid dehalogenase [Methyloceanibacter superfactus]